MRAEQQGLNPSASRTRWRWGFHWPLLQQTASVSWPSTKVWSIAGSLCNTQSLQSLCSCRTRLPIVLLKLYPTLESQTKVLQDIPVGPESPHGALILAASSLLVLNFALRDCPLSESFEGPAIRSGATLALFEVPLRRKAAAGFFQSFGPAGPHSSRQLWCLVCFLEACWASQCSSTAMLCANCP